MSAGGTVGCRRPDWSTDDPQPHDPYDSTAALTPRSPGRGSATRARRAGGVAAGLLIVIVVLALIVASRFGGTTTAGPPGGPIPTTSPRGWTEVFGDDFTEPSMRADALWGTYFGRPGGDPAGWWDPSHDVITDSELQIQGEKDDRDVRYGERPGTWVTGGIMSRFTQTYGKYLVRVRMDPGQGIGGVLLLWPADNRWPPEIDFGESNGADPRHTSYATLHYGAEDRTITRSTTVDLTRWHTVGLEWTKDRLVFTLDGRDWATITGDSVPDVPMRLDIQTGENACGGSFEVCPGEHTPAHVDMDIGWVVVYAPSRAYSPLTARPPTR
jgi:beta-glucanase (GH16 family)